MPEANTNRPWVEKYRPSTFDELVAHEDVVGTLDKFIANDTMPHLLFYGPPGTGKTTTVLAAARKMYSAKEFGNMVLELNASDDRGIGVVRGQIINFASSKSLMAASSKKPKLIILDEADAMTNDAQNALRRVIEKYTEHARFCIICNYLSKIIPALQSRCTRFRFAPLSNKLIVPRLNHICEQENVKITDDGRDALISLAKGDMRRVLNVLQSCSLAFDEVNSDTVHATVGKPTRAHVKNMLNSLLNEPLQQSFARLLEYMRDHGYALADIVQELHPLLLRLEISSTSMCVAESHLAEIEASLANGANEKLQLGGLCSAFMFVRTMIGNEQVVA